MHIAFDFCIYYNAIRQREMRSPCSLTSKQKPRKCVRLSGFSIPIFGVERLNSTGWLPTIYHRPTI